MNTQQCTHPPRGYFCLLALLVVMSSFLFTMTSADAAVTITVKISGYGESKSASVHINDHTTQFGGTPVAQVSTSKCWTQTSEQGTGLVAGKAEFSVAFYKTTNCTGITHKYRFTAPREVGPVLVLCHSDTECAIVNRDVT